MQTKFTTGAINNKTRFFFLNQASPMVITMGSNNPKKKEELPNPAYFEYLLHSPSQLKPPEFFHQSYPG
jgi:hypothetical protein